MIVKNIYRVFGVQVFSTETHVDDGEQFISNVSGQYELAPAEVEEEYDEEYDEDSFGFRRPGGQ